MTKIKNDMHTPTQSSTASAQAPIETRFSESPFQPLPYIRLLTSIGVLLVAFCFARFLLAQEKAPNTAEESPSPRTLIDPKAQELLNQAVRALGGDAFLNAKSIRTSGRTFAISEGSTAGMATFESTIEYPNKRRFSYGKDKPVILINDGERGWQLDRYGMVRQKPEEVRIWSIVSRYGYENLFRAVIREPGLLIQEAGREFQGPLSTRVVTVTDAQKTQIRVYIDAKTSLPVRVNFRQINPETREWEDYGEAYGEFKDFQGIRAPMQITRFRDGERSGETFRKTVEFNVAIPANYFTPGG